MKKNLNIAGVLLVAFCLFANLFICCRVADAASPTEAKDSVVCIGINDSNGNLIGWGSGFAIGEPDEPVRYIVTNSHVAEPTDDYGNYIQCSLTVYFSAAANQSMMAEVYWSDPQSDLAILRLPEETVERKALVLCPMDKVDMDDEFAALGYPATSMAADFVKFDKTDISITRGGISKQVRVAGRDCYLLDIKISQGNSGGPLVNSDGEVVGVNTFMLNDEARYAVAIDELIDEVSQDEVPYVISGEGIPMLYIGIASAVILVLLIVVVIVVMTSKKNKSVAASQVPDVQADFRPEQYTVPIQTFAEPVISYRLIPGIASPLAGQSFVVNKEIMIGRDSSVCDVAFPVDTRGVSAKHCKLTPEEGGILLEDLGSSYGTFLSDGRKLSAGQARMLKPGDAFYLGGEDNRFEVK